MVFCCVRSRQGMKQGLQHVLMGLVLGMVGCAGARVLGLHDWPLQFFVNYL